MILPPVSDPLLPRLVAAPPNPGARIALAWVAVAGIAVVHAPAIARAERCVAGDEAVGLVFRGDWPEGRQGAVVAELRAALAVQELELCLEVPSDAPPIASLQLVAVGDGAVRVEVRDRVTAKRVERDLALSAFPADARPLAIAIAADELLRATWAELVLVDAPAPAIEPPAPVRAMVHRERRQVTEETTGRSAAPRFLGLGGELRWHGGGTLFGGAMVRIEIGVHRRLGVVLSGGASRAQATVVPSGSVDGLAVRGGLDLLLALAGDVEGLQLAGWVGARAGWARFRGAASDQPSTVASDTSGATVSAQLGLEGRAHFGAFQLRLGAWVGAAFAALVATADGDDVTGTQGVEVGLTLGVGVRL